MESRATSRRNNLNRNIVLTLQLEQDACGPSAVLQLEGTLQVRPSTPTALSGALTKHEPLPQPVGTTSIRAPQVSSPTHPRRARAPAALLFPDTFRFHSIEVELEVQVPPHLQLDIFKS